MMPKLGKVSIFAYCAPTDMRKGYEGLSSLVREELGSDPLSDNPEMLLCVKT